MNEKAQLAAVQQYGRAIEYISKPSEAMQMAAVQQNGCAIEYISKPSEAVQLAAVHKMVVQLNTSASQAKLCN